MFAHPNLFHFPIRNESRPSPANHENRSARAHGFLICLLMVAYVWLGSIAAYFIYYRPLQAHERIFDLPFFYGPLVKHIVAGTGYWAVFQNIHFTAHRMPLIPLFLASIAAIANNMLFAVLAKNFVFGSLLIWGSLRAYSLMRRVPAAFRWLAVVLALSMPQVLHYAFCLEMEEGYLIAPIFFLFTHFSSWPTTAPWATNLTRLRSSVSGLG